MEIPPFSKRCMGVALLVMVLALPMLIISWIKSYRQNIAASIILHLEGSGAKLPASSKRRAPAAESFFVLS